MQALRKAGPAVVVGIVALIASQAGAQQPQSDAQSAPAQQAPAPADAQPSTAVQVTPPAGLLTPPPAAAAPDPARPAEPPRPFQRRAAMELDAAAIIGSQVRNGEGREIGRVSRLMVDPDDGRIATVVIGVGGTFGFGERQLAVPWTAVKLGEDRQRLVVIVDQRLLDQAPRAQHDRRGDPAASPGGGTSRQK